MTWGPKKAKHNDDDEEIEFYFRRLLQNISMFIKYIDLGLTYRRFYVDLLAVYVSLASYICSFMLHAETRHTNGK